GVVLLVAAAAGAVTPTLAPASGLGSAQAGGERAGPARRDLLRPVGGSPVMKLDPTVFAALASIDGATVTDRSGRLLAAGAILRHPASTDFEHEGIVEGARTTAAMAASRFGPVLKVSADGVITFFDRERIWDI